MGWTEQARQKHPTLKQGFTFTVERASKKVDKGFWEIVENKSVPYYKCRRILKNGSYATWSTSNERILSESLIYANLDKNTPFII